MADRMSVSLDGSPVWSWRIRPVALKGEILCAMARVGRRGSCQGIRISAKI
jgi:hypothetical protein